VKILIVGGGIGGLTAAIALCRKGFDVEIIEKDPDWTVYGVGIIQQANVVRAVAQLGILDEYLDASVGFDFVEVYEPSGDLIARIPTAKLAQGYPSNLGIGRPALQKVLGDNARKAGAAIRLGLVVETLDQDADGVSVRFSDGSEGRYDLIVGADGLYSQMRQMIFPDAREPEFTGQGVWRYNLPRPAGLDCLRSYEGQVASGLVPLTRDLVYMFITTPEPGNPHYPRHGQAAKMREKLAHAAPPMRAMADRITDDDGVVYKPLEWHFLDGRWHQGRVVLMGDAVHGTTPHLGQGAGMAIEDGIVLAEELARQPDNPAAALQAYRDRRFERCKFIVETSVSICFSQLGKGPHVEQAPATQKMFEVTAQPI
jgi:2-polyprenyl-6-methoxyphenol hydroxylase-like FAD-dependent oxidoreductase